MKRSLPPLPNIESLVDGVGEITIGSVGPVACAATACTEHETLAMLVRRDGETLVKLLMRLEAAIEMAVEEQIYIDEINYGADDRI